MEAGTADIGSDLEADSGVDIVTNHRLKGQEMGRLAVVGAIQNQSREVKHTAQLSRTRLSTTNQK